MDTGENVPSEEVTQESIDPDKSDSKLPEKIVRKVECQINVRQNGEMEVVVPGDPVLGQQLTHRLQLQYPPSFVYQKLTAKFSNNWTNYLSTIPQLEEINSRLQSKEPFIRHKMTETLKGQEGESGEEFLELNLRNFITNELAMEFSWSGRDGKKSFRDLKALVSFLIEFTLQRFPETTVYKLEKMIKNWLQQASDRLTSQLNELKL